MRAMRSLAAVVVACLPLAASAEASLVGAWEGSLGLVRLEERGGKLVGRLLFPRPGIPFAEGAEVVRGTPVSDSLTAEVRVPLSGCAKREAWAGGILLTAMAGNLLTGAVTVGEQGCTPRALGRTGGFALRRVPEDELAEALAEARAEFQGVAVAAAIEAKPAAAPTPTPTAKPAPTAATTAKPAPTAATTAKPKPNEPWVPRQPEADPEASTFGEEAVAAAARQLRPLGTLEKRAVVDPGLLAMRRAQAQVVMRDAQAYLQEGAFERARSRFLEAIEIDPTLPEAYNGVGVSHYARNQHEPAAGWYRRALAVDPDFGDAYYNLACLAALGGRRDEAFRLLGLAVANSYTTDDALEHDHDLDGVRADPRFAALRRKARGPAPR